MAFLVLTAVLAGCARFQSKPISPALKADAFEQRSLTNAGLKVFLETNGVVSAWPREGWDPDTLTLAAFYYQPELEMAWAKWQTVRAGSITAGQRPNPSLAFTPGLNSSSIGSGTTPWIFGVDLDIPVETAGKRKYRLEEARHLNEAARYELVQTAWLVRGRLRKSLLDLQAARETAALARDQAQALGRVTDLTERQWRAGAVSSVEVSLARIAQQNAQLTFKENQRLEAEARGHLAEAIGVPLRALDGVTFDFPDLTVFPTNLTSGELRRQAVLKRADVLGALAAYAASESALQIQIAKQYPDIHFQPGYELDQTDNKWSLGLSVDLPILNQNQGPIAEAEAKREEMAVHFNAVQARALGEIDRAGAVYFAAIDQAATAQALLKNLQEHHAAMTRMHAAGEVDLLAVHTAQADYLNGALAQLKARVIAQQALVSLEDAVQSPFLLPANLHPLETAAGQAHPPDPPGNR